MYTRTSVVRVLVLLPALVFAGCNVAPSHTNYQRIEVRQMSNLTRAAIESRTAESTGALSRMDAYRASLHQTK